MAGCHIMYVKVGQTPRDEQKHQPLDRSVRSGYLIPTKALALSRFFSTLVIIVHVACLHNCIKFPFCPKGAIIVYFFILRTLALSWLNPQTPSKPMSFYLARSGHFAKGDDPKNGYFSPQNPYFPRCATRQVTL